MQVDMHKHIYLDKKDGGNVTTQEIGTYLVYHYYLAESCQQAHFNNQRERESQRDREVCHAVAYEDQATCVVAQLLKDNGMCAYIKHQIKI